MKHLEEVNWLYKENEDTFVDVKNCIFPLY